MQDFILDQDSAGYHYIVAARAGSWCRARGYGNILDAYAFYGMVKEDMPAGTEIILYDFGAGRVSQREVIREV